MQEGIAGLIAKSLSLKFGGSAPAVRAVNPEAFQLLLEGRHQWSLRSEEGFVRAEARFARAALLDPQSAAVHEAPGDLWTMWGLYRGLGGEPFADRLAKGEAAARRALQLDPDRAQPHAPRGTPALLRTQWATAEREFKTAIARAPNNAIVRDWHGDLLHETGRRDQAIEENRKAAQFDPLACFILSDLGWACSNARRFAGALPPLERAAGLVPGPARIDVLRATALAGLGQAERARELHRASVPGVMAGQTGFRLARAIHLLEQVGRKEEARRLGGSALARLPPDNYLRGTMLRAVGRHDEGFAVFEKTIASGFHSRWMFWDPNTIRCETIRGSSVCSCASPPWKTTKSRVRRSPGC